MCKVSRNLDVGRIRESGGRNADVDRPTENGERNGSIVLCRRRDGTCDCDEGDA